MKTAVWEVVDWLIVIIIEMVVAAIIAAAVVGTWIGLLSLII